MRTIQIPLRAIARAVNGPFHGSRLLVPVQVDWPELQLTEEQILANAAALASGVPTPFPDPSIFTVEIPYYPHQAAAAAPAENLTARRTD